MGSRLRVAICTAVVLATAALPTAALANPANAPANTDFGPTVATGAQTEGGIGPSASFAAKLGLADDSVHRLLGVTPPGDPYSGPQPPPICGPGCSGTG